MPPNEGPNVLCAKEGAAILPLEGVVNDPLPVVCRVNEPLREAAIVLLFAKVEPLVLVFVILVRFALKTVEEALRTIEGPITVLFLTSDVVEALVTGSTLTNVYVLVLKEVVADKNDLLIHNNYLVKINKNEEPREQEIPPPEWVRCPAIQIRIIIGRSIESDCRRTLVMVIVVYDRIIGISASRLIIRSLTGSISIAPALGMGQFFSDCLQARHSGANMTR